MSRPVARSDDSVEATRAKSTTRFTWKQKLLAVFVTWHLAAVIVYVLPYPQYFDENTLNRPESREELHRLFSTLKPFAPWWQTEQEMQTKVLGYVQSYMNGYFAARKVFEPYLEITGSTQMWNMFAGTPPRRPLVFMVDVFPRGERAWVPFQDMNWGTQDFKNIHFRHFEAQGNLSAPGWEQHRAWYAQYWARRWNQRHPSRRAQFVRLYYLRLTTPRPERVRAGDSDRRPERVQESIWSIPGDVYQ
jgi:hypothetical protein